MLFLLEFLGGTLVFEENRIWGIDRDFYRIAQSNFWAFSRTWSSWWNRFFVMLISLQNESSFAIHWGIISAALRGVSLTEVKDSCQGWWRRKKEERFSFGTREGTGEETGGEGPKGCVCCTCERETWEASPSVVSLVSPRSPKGKEPCGKDSPLASPLGFRRKLGWTRSLLCGNVPQIAYICYLTDWSVIPGDHSNGLVRDHPNPDI